MALDRNTKTFIAMLTLVAAGILIVEHLVTEDPIEQWWLAGLLLAISIAFWVWLWQEAQEESSAMVVSEVQEDQKLSNMQEWIISKEDPTLLKEESDQGTAAAVAEPKEVAPAEPVVEEKPEPEPEAPAQPVTEEPVASEPAPAPAPSGEPDDLSRINGIGPKYKQILNDAGITTFAQLANTKTEDIEKAIQEAGARRISNYETWPKQAEFLAKGDEAGLEAYLEEIQ